VGQKCAQLLEDDVDCADEVRVLAETNLHESLLDVIVGEFAIDQITKF